MKKTFALIPVAALALMTACTNESTEFVGQPEAREISFSPLAQNATRAAVDGTTFPTTYSMEVAAYDVTNSRDFFGATTFSYNSTSTKWAGGKYWPLSAAQINFLAYADFNGETATWNTNPASGVALVMTDNSSSQKDLMYAIGNGAVTQSDNTLTFPEKVDMEFKHAQAWVTFTVKANSSAETAITVNSITLNGAKYDGTYTITHTNYDKSSGQSVAGAWSSLGDAQNVAVPGWTADALTTDAVKVGNGLMIVPDDAATGDFTSFTINYTVDDKTYDYTYTPATTNVEQAKKYTYNITFKLHEILINPSVADWTAETATNVTIQE